MQGDGEFVTFGSQSKDLQYISRDLERHALDLTPIAFDDAIEPDVVFKRVRADDIVIVWIYKPQRNSGGTRPSVRKPRKSPSSA